MLEKANILVSETVDHSLMGEHFFDTLQQARKELLSEYPVIIPAKAIVFMQGIELRTKDIFRYTLE